MNARRQLVELQEEFRVLAERVVTMASLKAPARPAPVGEHGAPYQ